MFVFLVSVLCCCGALFGDQCQLMRRDLLVDGIVGTLQFLPAKPPGSLLQHVCGAASLKKKLNNFSWLISGVLTDLLVVRTICPSLLRFDGAVRSAQARPKLSPQPSCRAKAPPTMQHSLVLLFAAASVVGMARRKHRYGPNRCRSRTSVPQAGKRFDVQFADDVHFVSISQADGQCSSSSSGSVTPRVDTSQQVKRDENDSADEEDKKWAQNEYLSEDQEEAGHFKLYSLHCKDRRASSSSTTSALSQAVQACDDSEASDSSSVCSHDTKQTESPATSHSSPQKSQRTPKCSPTICVIPESAARACAAQPVPAHAAVPEARREKDISDHSQGDGVSKSHGIPVINMSMVTRLARRPSHAIKEEVGFVRKRARAFDHMDELFRMDAAGAVRLQDQERKPRRSSIDDIQTGTVNDRAHGFESVCG